MKSQELTALFLAVRLYCSFVMEFDIHTLLDSATLVTTLWVIYMIRFKLKASYMEDKDNFAIYYVVSCSSFFLEILGLIASFSRPQLVSLKNVDRTVKLAIHFLIRSVTQRAAFSYSIRIILLLISICIVVLICCLVLKSICPSRL